jgi:hypothetical protein
MVTNSIHHPCQDYIEGWDKLDNDAMEMDHWLGRVVIVQGHTYIYLT